MNLKRLLVERIDMPWETQRGRACYGLSRMKCKAGAYWRIVVWRSGETYNHAIQTETCKKHLRMTARRLTR